MISALFVGIMYHDSIILDVSGVKVMDVVHLRSSANIKDFGNVYIVINRYITSNNRG